MRSVALVVDDDADVRSLAAILEETDLRVIEASSGEEALDYLRTQAGEVVFLFTDVRLPCLMSGVDLARNVQSNWPWIRVMVTSGAPLDQNEVAELPREVGFMPKPWKALDVLIEAERANVGEPPLALAKSA
jgi:DNA-binding NtrC family response regulator